MKQLFHEIKINTTGQGLYDFTEKTLSWVKKQKIESTLTSVDSLFVGVSNVLNKDTQDNLKNTLENLSISLENINKASVVLSDLLISNQDNFSSTMNNLSNT